MLSYILNNSTFESSEFLADETSVCTERDRGGVEERERERGSLRDREIQLHANVYTHLSILGLHNLH